MMRRLTIAAIVALALCAQAERSFAAVALTDEYQLSLDGVFQNRVQAALIATCVAIGTENPTTTPFHRERQNYAEQILNSGVAGNQAAYVTQFSVAVATVTAVINDATQNGTVSVTSGNRATQAALVLDTDINNAVSAVFNTFIRLPGS